MGVRRGLAAAVAMLVVAGCTVSTPDSEPRPDPTTAGRHDVGCGPTRAEQVSGQRPDYVTATLDRYPNDHAACRAHWLPETGAAFVPQGLVVRGRNAWISGYDGGGPDGTRYCRVVRVDLTRDRIVTQRGELVGEVGDRGTVPCRHGGGLVRDRHGLWLTETTRVWLLDPATLAVLRGWALRPPLSGGFALHDGQGRLGVGDYRDHGRPRLWWFDTADLLAPGRLDLAPDLAVGSRRVPTSSQGGFVRNRGGGDGAAEQVWFVSADSRCGRLVGPGGAVGFVPGAEGAALEGHRLWVVSESATEVYAAYGDRPVVPHLTRFDLRDVADWSPPTCDPSSS